MRTKFNISLIILILMLTSIYGQEKRYRVVINSIPDGAKVFLNGKLRANTPCGFSAGENFELNIAIHKEGFKLWKNNYTVTNNLKINPELIDESDGREYVTTHSVNFTSNPSGADVNINGKLEGQSPFSKIFPVGLTLDVQLIKQGFKSWNESFTTSDDIRKLINLKSGSGGNKKSWIIAGSVLAGGGLIALITSKDSGGKNQSGNSWPQPPSRP